MLGDDMAVEEEMSYYINPEEVSQMSSFSKKNKKRRVGEITGGYQISEIARK